jgi:hypothetical protein
MVIKIVDVRSLEEPLLQLSHLNVGKVLNAWTVSDTII